MRCPPGWQLLPEVQSALAATWRELGELEKARKAYLTAIQAEGDLGRVPVKDIEQLANVEARLGERMAGKATDAKTEREAEALVRLAITRLKKLDEIVGGQTDTKAARASALVIPERSALLGSAFKRQASLYARKLLKPDVKEKEKSVLGDKMEKALKSSIEAYRSAEGTWENGRLNPYLALNRLALDALTPWDTEARKDEAIALAQQCKQAAEQAYARSGDIWDAVMQPEAVLVEHLLDGSFSKTGVAGQVAFDAVLDAYTEALQNITIKPSELDSVVSQMELLSRFYDAKDVANHEPALQRTADRLVELVRRLQPSRTRRDDRPGAKKADAVESVDVTESPPPPAAPAAAQPASAPTPKAKSTKPAANKRAVARRPARKS